MKRLIATSIILLSLTCFAHASYLALGRRTIADADGTHVIATVTNPDSALTDFSLLVDLSDMPASWWSAVDTNDGTKGRVFKGDGTTELACDWINFDDTVETGTLRVLWSGSLASSGTQELWIEPPVSTNSSYGATDTYGSDNAYNSAWLAYWPEGGGTDRTSNGYDLTAVGSPTVGGGSIKGLPATEYDGSSQYAYNDSLSMNNRAAATLISWVDKDSGSTAGTMMAEWGDTAASERTFTYSIESDDTIIAGIKLDDGAVYPTSTGTITDDTDTQIAIKTVSGTQKIFINGSNDGSATGTGDFIAYSDRFSVAVADAETTPNKYFNGELSELQVHSTNRSDDWIAYEYDQVNNNYAFWGSSWIWEGEDIGDGIALKTINTYGTDTIRMFVFADGAGTTVTDYSPNSEDASLVEATWSDEGVTIDADDEYLRTAVPTTGQGIGGTFSFFAVFRSVTSSGAGNSEYGKFTAIDQGDSYFSISRYEADTTINISIGGTYYHQWTGVPDLWDTYTHTIGVSFDETNDQICLYIDGSLEGSCTSTGVEGAYPDPTWASSTYMGIGGRTAEDRPLNGVLSAWYLWDKEIDAAGFLSLHNDPYQMFYNPPSGRDFATPPTPPDQVFTCDTEYYLESTGDASGDGSSWSSSWDIDDFDSNWTAINSGLSTGNVCFYLKKGDTFTQEIELSTRTDNTNRLIFTTHPDDTGSKPIMSIGDGELQAFDWTAKGYITINGLNIRYLYPDKVEADMPTYSSTGIVSRDGDTATNAGHIHITDNDLFGWRHYAVMLYRSGDHCVVTGNTFSKTVNGLYFGEERSGSQYSQYHYVANNSGQDFDKDKELDYDAHFLGLQAISNSVIENNHGIESGSVMMALWQKGAGALVKENVFRNNTFDDSNWGMIQTLSASATSTSVGTEIHRNWFYKNLLIDANRNQVMTPPGFFFQHDTEPTAALGGNRFFHNTCVDSWTVGYRGEDTDYYTVWNNVFTRRATSEDDLVVFANTNSNVSIENNLYWVAGFNKATDAEFDDKLWATWQGQGKDDASPDPQDPDFVYPEYGYYEPDGDSPLINAGAFLSHVDYASSGSGSGTTIVVDEPLWFHGNMGVTDAEGDTVEGMLISFYDETNSIQEAEVTAVDYDTNTLTVTPSISYIYDASDPTDPTDNTQIALGGMRGPAPDIGAFESDNPIYVAESGAGDTDGTSYADRMSVASHNAGTFTAGDTIYLCDAITSKVIPPSNGSAGLPITYRTDYSGYELSMAPSTMNVNGAAISLDGRSYITITGEGTPAVIDGGLTSGTVDTLSANEYRSLIYVSNSSHITIDNLELKRGYTAIYGGDIDNLTLTRNKISLNRCNGVWLDDGDNLTIGGSSANANEFDRNTNKTVYGDNKIGADIRIYGGLANYVISYNDMHGTDAALADGWGMIGLALYGCNTGVIEYNEIHDYGAKNFRGAIHAKGLAANYDTIIRYNNIYDLPVDDTWFYVSGRAISITRDTYNYRVYGNRIHDVYSGIGGDINGEVDNTDGTNGVDIEDLYIWANSLSEIHGSCFSFWDGWSGNTDDFDDIYIVNNSCAISSDGAEIGSIYFNFNYGADSNGTDDTGTAPHLNIKNNIILEPMYGESTRYAISMAEDDDGDYADIDYNLVYLAADSGNYEIKFGATVYDFDSTSLPAAWAGRANDPTPADPDFTAETTGDLTLSTGSPAINTGLDISAVSIPSITVSHYSGSALTFTFDRGLLPSTNWSTMSVVTGLQSDYTSPEIGAYIYVP